MIKQQTIPLDILRALTTFMASFALMVVAHAQPAAPAITPADSSSTSGVIPWSAIMERPSSGGPASFDKPGEVGMGADMGIGNTVKEAVRPIHEGLSQSGVIQSIREFDSGMGGGGKRQENPGQNSAGHPSGIPTPVTPAKTAQQIRREQEAASGMLDQLVKEATPWAAGLMGLLALGFAAKVWMDWMHAKAARPGKLRRSGRRRSRSSTSTSTNSLQSLEGTPADLDAPSARSPEGSRTGRRSSGSSSSSSRSSSASSSSDTASGRRRHRSRRPQP